MRRTLTFAAATAGILMASSAMAQDIKIALIAGKTGPLEAYAKQTETGFMMGLEYLTKGTMSWQRPQDQRHRQGRPAQGRPRARRCWSRPTTTTRSTSPSAPPSSAAALAMLPVAEENGKVLIVEPAVADAITGDKWNRYIFRTGAQLHAGRSWRCRGHSGKRRSDRRDAGAGLRLRPRRRCRAQEGARRDPPEREGGVRGICARRTPPTSPLRRSACSTR